jgi:hypothetical protein
LRSNRRRLARQFAAHLIYRFFKRLFPAEINQRADNKNFKKQTHGKATFSKSRPQRNRELGSGTVSGFLFEGSIAKQVAHILAALWTPWEMLVAVTVE